MAARIVPVVSAAAVLAAAVAVYAVLRERDRRLRREAAAQRQMAGGAHRDTVALREQLEVFRRRLNPLLAQQAVIAAAGLVLDDALHHDTRIDPTTEGGPR